jgi:peptide/nickel transport system permease protein
MVRLIPGNPAANVVGGYATAGELEQVRHQLGLDTPVLVQFKHYVADLAHGNLGRSFETQEPVSQIIEERWESSAELAAGALVLILMIAVPAGMIAGALTRDGRHRRLEVGFTGVMSVVGSFPSYFTATVLAFVFAVELRALPFAGSTGLRTLILPAVAIALAEIGTLSRIVHGETLNVLAQDYMRTARSKHLSTARLYIKHAAPNLLTATLTIAGLFVASVIASAVVVETVFARAGLGSALVNAVLAKDYPVVQGLTLLLGVVVIIVNFVVDIMLAIIDPRSQLR